jgi:tRNA A37 threonylcarbamoyladenosine dehydratase
MSQELSKEGTFRLVRLIILVVGFGHLDGVAVFVLFRINFGRLAFVQNHGRQDQICLENLEISTARTI